MSESRSIPERARSLVTWVADRRRKILLGTVTIFLSLTISVPLFILCIAEPLSRTQAWKEYRTGVKAYNDPSWQQRPEPAFRSYFATVDDPIEFVLASNISRTIPQLDGQWIRHEHTTYQLLNQGWHLIETNGVVRRYLAHRFLPDNSELPALGGRWEILMSSNAESVRPWLIDALNPRQPTPDVTKLSESATDAADPNSGSWVLAMDYEFPLGADVSGGHWMLTPAESHAGIPTHHRTWAHHINSEGYRGKSAVTTAHSEDEFRVAFVGDSMTFGWGVAEHETLPAMVEARLRKDGLPARCFNLAVPGYNTRQELRRLRRRFDEVDPDVIVLGYCINDAEPPFSLQVPNPERYYRYAPLNSWFLERSKKPTRLVMMATYRQLNNLVASMGIDWPWLRDLPMDRLWLPDRGHIGSPHLLEGWTTGPKRGEAQAALRDLVTFCREKNTPLLAYLIPALNGSPEEYEYRLIHQDVAAWAKELELPFEDVLPILATHPDWSELRVWEKDGHPNAKALRMIASRVAQALRQVAEQR